MEPWGTSDSTDRLSNEVLVSFNKKAGVRLSLEKQSSFSHICAINMLKCICKA